MHNISVLIVEDESLIAHDIADTVEEFGFKVPTICTSGTDALQLIDQGEAPSIILMDINLDSDLNGIETARRIKQKQDIPIIYLTAFVDDETIQKAIDTHPSNYLTKPFSPPELHAALKIALTQIPSQEQAQRGDIRIDDEFSFDSEGMQLIRNGEYVKLTKKETQLLQLLIARKNQIVPFDVIEIELWPDKEPNENTRRALVSRLRSKLGNKHIETIVSMGYRLQI